MARWLLAGLLVFALSWGLCGELAPSAHALPLAAGSKAGDCASSGHAASQPCPEVCGPISAPQAEREALAPSALPVAPASLRWFAFVERREPSLPPTAFAGPSPPLYVLFLKLLL
jgi:hypothetical protein